MTVFEHAMLGASLAVAAGLERRFGWRVVVLAGVAGTVSDWDGLSILLGGEAYAHWHRRLAHNLLVAAGLGAAWAWLDARFGITARIVGRATNNPAANPRGAPTFVWVSVAMLAAVSHLPIDVIYSGGSGTAIWGVPLLWPFSEREWSVPVVPWGDLGATLIFIGEMFALYRWPRRAQRLALAALLALAAYIAARSAYSF